MDRITLTPWQSAVLHGLATFVFSAATLFLTGHPDIANMTIAGVVAAVWNALQNRTTTDMSA